MQLRHQLGGYLEFGPPDIHASFVEAMWIHRSPASLPSNPTRRHRVLPDPAVGIAFVCRRDSNGLPSSPQVVVLGPVTGTREFAIVPGVEMVAVKVKLERVQALDLDPWEHVNRIDDAADVHPGWAREMLDALVDTDSATGALATLLESVRRRAVLRSRRSTGGIGSWAMDRIRETSGNIDVTGLAAESGFSDRHVRRSVLRTAGISPKRYARTLRFLNAITRADTMDRPSWAGIAAEAGFTDQSHLIRDCRSLTGHTPAQLFRERLQESEISNLERV